MATGLEEDDALLAADFEAEREMDAEREMEAVTSDEAEASGGLAQQQLALPATPFAFLKSVNEGSCRYVVVPNESYMPPFRDTLVPYTPSGTTTTAEIDIEPLPNTQHAYGSITIASPWMGGGKTSAKREYQKDLIREDPSMRSLDIDCNRIYSVSNAVNLKKTAAELRGEGLAHVTAAGYLDKKQTVDLSEHQIVCCSFESLFKLEGQSFGLVTADEASALALKVGGGTMPHFECVYVLRDLLNKPGTRFLALDAAAGFTMSDTEPSTVTQDFFKLVAPHRKVVSVALDPANKGLPHAPTTTSHEHFGGAWPQVFQYGGLGRLRQSACLDACIVAVGRRSAATAVEGGEGGAGGEGCGGEGGAGGTGGWGSWAGGGGISVEGCLEALGAMLHVLCSKAESGTLEPPPLLQGGGSVEFCIQSVLHRFVRDLEEHLCDRAVVVAAVHGARARFNVSGDGGDRHALTNAAFQLSHLDKKYLRELRWRVVRQRKLVPDATTVARVRLHKNLHPVHVSCVDHNDTAALVRAVAVLQAVHQLRCRLLTVHVVLVHRELVSLVDKKHPASRLFDLLLHLFPRLAHVCPLRMRRLELDKGREWREDAGGFEHVEEQSRHLRLARARVAHEQHVVRLVHRRVPFRAHADTVLTLLFETAQRGLELRHPNESLELLLEIVDVGLWHCFDAHRLWPCFGARRAAAPCAGAPLAAPRRVAATRAPTADNSGTLGAAGARRRTTRALLSATRPLPGHFGVGPCGARRRATVALGVELQARGAGRVTRRTAEEGPSAHLIAPTVLRIARQAPPVGRLRRQRARTGGGMRRHVIGFRRWLLARLKTRRLELLATIHLCLRRWIHT